MSEPATSDQAIAFSIVMPLYNKEISVFNTAQSILNQSHPQLELIVVDDGSTDSSVENLSAIDDERLSIIRQANAGVSVARNVGANAAKHDYVAFIDADDLWHRDFLSIMNQLIQAMPDQPLFATRWQFCSRHDTLPANTHTFSPAQVKHVDYIEASFDGVVANICSVVIRKQDFLDVGGFPEGVKHFEDQDLMCKLARKNTMVLYDEALVYYVRDAENRACHRREVQDMPPFFVSSEPLMLKDFPKDSADWHYKEFLIARYLAEFSLAAQTPGERGRAFRLLMLCRKTQRSKLRLFKGFAYMLMPAKFISFLIDRVNDKAASTYS